MLLRNKVALITGGASGIGRATAQLFACEGAKVIIVDQNEADGQKAAETIRQESGRASFVQADVGSDEQVRSAIQTALRQCGRIDILHSNAAAYKVGFAHEISEVDWDRTLNVCLKATWMLAKEVAPVMLDHAEGVIIITGSVHAIRGYPRHTAYQAAKGGLLALTRALAADYAPTIRVNTILPGAIVTGLWEDIPESEREKIAQMCPLKRNGRPEDVAQAALFLASEMSAYMTGSVLIVDGGLTAIAQP